jgi:hypothetical protein
MEATMAWLKTITWQIVLSLCVCLLTIAVVFWFLGEFPSQATKGSQILLTAFQQAFSVVVTKDGKPIQLTSTVFLRIPAESPNPTTQPEPLDERFTKFNAWLNTELGGWSRWPAESQSMGSVEQPGKTWMYVIGIADARPNVTAEITNKVNEIFPDLHPILIIELPHPLVPVDQQPAK